MQQLNGTIFVQTKDYQENHFHHISYYHHLNEFPAIEEKYVYEPWEGWFGLAPFVGKRSAKKLTQKYDSCYDA